MPRSFVAPRTPREKHASNIAGSLLQSTTTHLQTVFSASGNVGGSIGLLDDGTYAFRNIGACAIDDDQCPTETTTYLISSMTKPFMGLAISLLVADKTYGICFETPVKTIIPELEGRTRLSSEQPESELTIAHLLAHRSEFLKYTNLWESPGGVVPWTTIDPVLSLLRHMPLSSKYTAGSFDNGRNYSNECFALLAEVIERVTRIPWGKFVTEKILKPLHLNNTFAGVPKHDAHKRSNFVASHTVSVDGLIPGRHEQSDSRSRSCKASPKAEPLLIQPSQACFAGPGYKQTPMGAAAGMLSSARDLLKFYDHLLQAFHSLSTASNGPNHGVSEIERGMAIWWKHILSRTEAGNSIYAGGWNTTQIPWSPCDVRHRWPGSDGDNARRLLRAMEDTHSGGVHTANRIWYFFQQLAVGGGSGGKRLALYHGGNMVGATSFCFLVPSLNQAVVVLCNTRGFQLDAANLTCMFLADALARKVTNPRAIKTLCSNLDTVIRHIKGSYIRDLALYETRLDELYPCVADANDFAGCIGRFQLAEGVFADIFRDVGDALKFQLYGQGFRYPLRVRHDICAASSDVTMTFAMSMKDLVPLGVGGNNRLDIRDFELVFKGRDGPGGPFEAFVWVFDREGIQADGDMEVFTWKRVA
ncbi:beta-lactamase/transpeptidase-like protein [Triangularia verruculosa]|uniref:Beta-lactamase/transpeptidase-like protein n=1 Tax=Triangularia verruculosa TaxID=2587418 RepID=A0AAN6XEN3_9PEZI|nr:beta-lactamase/transpeptidase-like protein [Triangularia verruculosa]